MKSKLIALFLSIIMAVGTLFCLTTPASAITAEDIYYKNAFDATANAVGYDVNESWQVSELQKIITSARLKIQKLDPKSDAIPVFSQLLDERQQDVFVLVKNRVDNLSRVTDNPNICYYQYELSELRAIMTDIKKVCKNYPKDIEEKIEKYQDEKLNKGIELFNLCKANPTEKTIEDASYPIYDLSNIEIEHPKKEFIDNMFVEFQKIQETFYSTQVQGHSVKELLKSILDSATLKEEFQKYFDEDTVKKLTESSENLKKFIDEHDEDYLLNIILKVEEEQSMVG